MRGSGTFSADERPQNWRQGILLLFPNGDTPLTGILSKLSEEATDDPLFNWFEKSLGTRRGIIIGAATATGSKPADNADIAAADATAEVSITVKPDGGAEDDLTWLKPGHLLFNQVTEEVYLVIKKNADWINIRRDIGNKFASNPAITGDTAAGDSIVICGSGFPEGAPVGEVISYSPIRHHNNTQIHRTPLSVTRTARKTKLRTDRTGPYMEAKREALQLHGVELEHSFLFSEREEITSIATGSLSSEISGTSTGKPLRLQRGVINWLPTINTGTAASIHWDVGTAFSGGLSELTFDAWLEELFRYGSFEKLVFAGSTALNVLNQLAKNKLTIQSVPTDQTYGMALQRVITPFGNILLRQHPLMSVDPVWRKDLIAVDPAHLKYRYLDDTRFLRNRQSPGEDASVDEYLTEAGLECRWSGATSDSGGGLAAAAGPAVHGRLKGITQFIG